MDKCTIKDKLVNSPDSNTTYAADLFLQLPSDAQKAIIDLIKCLLSEK